MGRVKQKSRSILWPLHVLVVASLIGPALFFAYSAWANHRRIEQQAEERIERALDVLQEHTLKAFQTIERTIAETNEILRDLPPEDIRAGEERLQRRLRQTQDHLPQIEAIWVFDRSGRPLVSSTVFPVPRNLDNSDRDYFRAQAEQDAGTFIGRTITAKIGGIQFFVVSQRRPSPDGAFDGIIAISVRPEHFRDFYARMSQGIADSFGLIRADGEFLARYPSRGTETMRLNAQSTFVQAIRDAPEGGQFTALSQIDGIERRIGYRKVPGFPVYAQVGIETAAIWRELRSAMAGLLAFGVPTTLVLFGLSLYALAQTKSFHAEIERRQNAEAALKQAQRLEALGHLTGGVAHDFNNLLMVVKGSVDRLRRFPADERQKRSLDAIENAALRGAGLTRQLLSFSRKQTHEPAVVNLPRYLSGLQDMLRSSLRGDIAVEVRVPDETWNVKVDPSELELAILNIAVNARDAMPNGGSLRIEARNVSLSGADPLDIGGSFVALSLSDTGSGIPADLLPHVFEPFFTTKEVGKGTGLGLSQVYGFARQSGGTAVATSEPGHGTTITLYLPPTMKPATEDADRAVPAPRPDGQGHILLVEDNADIAEVTRSNLEELGYRVTQAADPRSALDVLGSGARFDLVFSDIVMPGDSNGVDLARTIRDRYPGLPILLTTGYSSMAQTAMDEGFPILRKPYDAADLDDSIRRSLSARSLAGNV
ncbi:hybrid sensor histidine kinase/response regulator [Microvirga lenta]|uniref:hybrid sensor histidine kinase/response regulator n=1 Tax=Microvirga lenta TaxID=2881337 RepID=UPI001CFF6DFE|nr:ATP-binding protein [Microvirga lenta]MCB5176977.1 response regulator [Microvirga lenta]